MGNDMQKTFSEITRNFLSDHQKNIFDQSLPDQAVQIMEEKSSDFIEYAIKHNMEDYEYESMLRSLQNLLEDMYSYLDVPTEERRKSKSNYKLDYREKPMKLWHTYTEDVFNKGCKGWEIKDEPDLYHYSPVEREAIEGCIVEYLAKPLINHPYISWALINAVLFDAGRDKIMNFDETYDDSYSSYATDTTKLIKKTIKKNKADIGLFFQKIESDANYDNFKKGLVNKPSIQDILLPVIVIPILYYFEYFKSIYVFIVIEVLLLWNGKNIHQRAINECLKNTDKIRSSLSTLKEAWLTANSQAVSLVRLKEKVREAELAGNKFSAPFHALVENTISNYGNSISVSGWI